MGFDLRTAALAFVLPGAACMVYGTSLLGEGPADVATDAGAEAQSSGFSVSAPPSLTLQQGSSAPVQVTVARTGGFADAIDFSVSGLPAGATSNPLTITSDSTTGALTLAIASSTPQGVSHVSIDGVAANGTISASAKMDLVVRGPPGALDLLYGDHGVVSGFLTTTNFGSFDAATLDASGNVLIAIDGALGGGDIYVVRIRADGTLDPTFGASGIATVPNIGVSFKAIFVLASGEIELCGLSENGKPWVDEVVRLDAKGAIDTSISPDGGIGNGFTRNDGQPYVFALDSKERIVETGFVGNATGFLLSRRTATGPDTSYDAGGFAPTVGGPGGSTLIQPDGKIVASFNSPNPPYGLGMVRTDDKGALDPSFGTSGIVPASGPNGASQIVLQSDGKIVAGGLVFASNGSENPGGFVARYGTNGALDVTYAAAGAAPISAGAVWAIAEQSNDDVLSVGYPYPSGNVGTTPNEIWIERLTKGGVPDTTFGNGGLVATPVGGTSEITIGEFVGVQSDGRIVVVAATMKSQGVYDFAVLRYWP
jgi:uncharacterized delta-60 repeat protein